MVSFPSKTSRPISSHIATRIDASQSTFVPLVRGSIRIGNNRAQAAVSCDIVPEEFVRLREGMGLAVSIEFAFSSPTYPTGFQALGLEPFAFVSLGVRWKLLELLLRNLSLIRFRTMRRSNDSVMGRRSCPDARVSASLPPQLLKRISFESCRGAFSICTMEEEND